MSHRSAAGNSYKTSSDQYAYDRQCVLRVGIIIPIHYMTVLNLAGIEFPILKDISKFEYLNAMSINVYIENGQVCGSPVTKKGQALEHVISV